MDNEHILVTYMHLLPHLELYDPSFGVYMAYCAAAAYGVVMLLGCV